MHTIQVRPHSPMLTTTEVARLLRVHPDTVRRWRAIGTGPRYAKLGNKSVRYALADVEAWVAAQSTAEVER
jgi:excisionase family DNA binding protein